MVACPRSERYMSSSRRVEKQTCSTTYGTAVEAQTDPRICKEVAKSLARYPICFTKRLTSSVIIATTTPKHLQIVSLVIVWQSLKKSFDEND